MVPSEHDYELLNNKILLLVKLLHRLYVAIVNFFVLKKRYVVLKLQKSKMKNEVNKTLYVVRAEYVGSVGLRIYFSDGTSKTVGFAPFILTHPPSSI